MSDLKKVKVDNWGIFFLQRLKHFFNRTDYCDLTLQFQDNAQLKVHRLVLNACTEYFEILERTCEMYEDCLIMPDDLQTDVMVPIINFMYTGQLEYKNDMLEKLYQTSRVMGMSVLTKLLDAQRQQLQETMQTQNVSVPYFGKRSYTKTFNNSSQKVYTPAKRPQLIASIPRNGRQTFTPIAAAKSNIVLEKRPTRYEVPEELDSDNIFENSFSNISYETQPLMVHPETKKRYERKKNAPFGIFCEASGSTKYDPMINGPSTSSLDLAECRRIENNDLYDDECASSYEQSSPAVQKDSNVLFDQMLEDGPKVTIETKDTPCPEKLDHAKIISEVLKKYPHLVKGNKNIRLKIVPPSKASALAKSVLKRRTVIENKPKVEEEDSEMDYTYESDVLDSKEAARLIALGAENIKGPWICLICGTPGKALYFTSYYKFRRHLVEVHKEKPIVSMCEYCGLKSGKRNYLLHHLYTQHGIPPPPTHNFPKCKQCNYVALTEAFLVKHRLTHAEGREFKCNVCNKHFKSTAMLLNHIQTSGHKICPDRKSVFQCIYCLKTFLRENNLYAHLKTCHKEEVKADGIIECSDEDEPHATQNKPISKKLSSFQSEPLVFDQDDLEDMSNQDQEFQTLSKNTFRHKQTILNQEFKPKHDNKTTRNLNSDIQNVAENIAQDIIKQFCSYDGDIPQNKRRTSKEDTAIVSNVTENTSSTQLNVIEQSQADNAETQQSRMIIKKSGNVNQPIQIVVSNEEEYKALIANHPIIFDENNAGKALAVLSTPHTNVTTAATLDINNTQSNEMVILPNEYPINVTEAVPADNSNIVVVYSHPVNEQNKQFIVDTQYAQQTIITTTQDVGTRFIESSAVITPNYETITSSTPIVSGQIVVQDPAMSWSQNVDGNIVSNVVTQISADQQYVVSDEQTKTIQEETDMINTHNSEFDQTDPITANEIVIPKAADDNSLLIMPDDLPVITDAVEKEVSTSDVIMESMEEELPSIVLPGAEIEHMEEGISNETEVNEETCVTNEHESGDKEETIQTKDEAIEENVDNSSFEWSEADNDANKNSVKGSTLETNSLDNDTDDMEETIENIEREIEKGNKASVTKNVTSNEVEEEQEINTDEPAAPSDISKPPNAKLKDKISSLLNDWDENGDASTVIKDEKKEDEVLVEDIAEEVAGEGPVIEQKSSQKEPGKPDIKKLVSDWEEEDEI